MHYLGAPGAVFATYLRRDAAEPGKVPPTAGVHTRGPGDGLIVEDGEGELAVRDEDDLESVYLQQGEGESSERAGGGAGEPAKNRSENKMTERAFSKGVFL